MVAREAHVSGGHAIKVARLQILPGPKEILAGACEAMDFVWWPARGDEMDEAGGGVLTREDPKASSRTRLWRVGQSIGSALSTSAFGIAIRPQTRCSCLAP